VVRGRTFSEEEGIVTPLLESQEIHQKKREEIRTLSDRAYKKGAPPLLLLAGAHAQNREGPAPRWILKGKIRSLEKRKGRSSLKERKEKGGNPCYRSSEGESGPHLECQEKEVREGEKKKGKNS